MSDAPGKCFYHGGQVPIKHHWGCSNLIVDLQLPNDLLVHLIVDPGLVAPHPMATNQLDRTVGSSGIQTIVIRHYLRQHKSWSSSNAKTFWNSLNGNVYLLPFGVGKHLISTQTVAIAHSHLWSVCRKCISSGFSSSPLRHFSFPWCPNNCGLRRSSSLPRRNSQEASGTQDTRAPGTTLQLISTMSQLSFSFFLLLF